MSAQNRIIVDWGTSNFRAFLFDADGLERARHHAPAGILSVEPGGFEAVLMREVGGWITPQSEILLSGMITSRNGWVETPYAEVPARLADLAARSQVRQAANGASLKFLAGVCQRLPLPDVMRGEEIQVFGAVGAEETATLILPGTHSKWVRVDAGRITEFRTFFTGEMFGVLTKHSILGRLVPVGEMPFNSAAFDAGVQRAIAADAGLLNAVFSARSGALLGEFPAGEIADRLSGMLIGAEIRGGLALGWHAGPVRLVGDPGLGARYRQALAHFGQSAELAPEDVAVEGFRRLAELELAKPERSA